MVRPSYRSNARPFAPISVSSSNHSGHVSTRAICEVPTSTTVPRVNPGDTYNYAPTLEPGSSPAAASSSSSDSLIHRIFGGIPEGKGALEVKTTPKGAQIVISGLAETHPAPHKYFLDPGSYQVTIKLEGYKPVQRSVRIEKGQGLQLNEPLQRQ